MSGSGDQVQRPGVGSAAAVGRSRWLTSFFERLAPLDPVLRIILQQAPLSVRIELRGDDPHVLLLDFGVEPVRIVVDQPERDGALRVAVPSDVLHRVLLGQLSAGEALGRRELLLRGAASDLARFVPLFDFAPLLYRDHLADLDVAGFERRRAAPSNREERMSHAKRDRGWLAFGGSRRPEAALARVVEQAAFAAGYGVGTLRHRYLRSLSLFEVMAAMARGVAAATPAAPADERAGRGDDG